MPTTGFKTTVGSVSRSSTVIVDVAVIESETFAVIVAVPALTPVTTPSATVATVVSEETHVTGSAAPAGSCVAFNVSVLLTRTYAAVKSKEIDSAGTEGYNELHHAGIHYGTKDVLRKNGISFSEHYSRKIRKNDYEYYDYIIAMDEENIKDIESIIGADKDNKISKLLDYTNNPRNIKDPWYSGNFEETYNDVVEGCEGLLRKLTEL